MSKDQLSTAVLQRICSHMNDDHKEALVAYARNYGGKVNAKQAKLIEITPETMRLEVNDEVIEIPFDHTLISSEDAHKTLVKMLKKIS